MNKKSLILALVLAGASQTAFGMFYMPSGYTLPYASDLASYEVMRKKVMRDIDNMEKKQAKRRRRVTDLRSQNIQAKRISLGSKRPQPKQSVLITRGELFGVKNPQPQPEQQ